MLGRHVKDQIVLHTYHFEKLKQRKRVRTRIQELDHSIDFGQHKFGGSSNIFTGIYGRQCKDKAGHIAETVARLRGCQVEYIDTVVGVPSLNSTRRMIDEDLLPSQYFLNFHDRISASLHAKLVLDCLEIIRSERGTKQCAMASNLTLRQLILQHPFLVPRLLDEVLEHIVMIVHPAYIRSFNVKGESERWIW